MSSCPPAKYEKTDQRPWHCSSVSSLSQNRHTDRKVASFIEEVPKDPDKIRALIQNGARWAWPIVVREMWLPRENYNVTVYMGMCVRMTLCDRSLCWLLDVAGTTDSPRVLTGPLVPPSLSSFRAAPYHDFGRIAPPYHFGRWCSADEHSEMLESK